MGTEEKRGTTFRSSTDEIFETLTRNNKIGLKKRMKVLGEKTGAQNIVKEIKHYQKKRLQHVQRMDRNRLPRQALKYRPQKEGTLDDRRRDGGTNSTLRTKEQGTHLTLNEHDDDDDDDICTLVLCNTMTGNLLYQMT